MKIITTAILASLAFAAAPAMAQSHKTDTVGSTRLKAPSAAQMKMQKAMEDKKKAAEAAKGQQSQTVATQAAATITIDPSSTYEDALTCYQFHGVSMQIANAMKARQGLADGQVQQYEAVARMSNYLQQKWFKRLGDVNGGKKVEEMNADLQKVASGVVADANAGLGGDEAAQKRNAAVKDKCHGFEKTDILPAGTPASDTSAAKPPG